MLKILSKCALYSYLAVFFSIFAFNPAQAAVFFESQTLGQIAIDQLNDYQFPLYEYISLDAGNKKNTLGFKTDFNVYGEPFDQEADFLIHQLVFVANRAFNVMDVELGRISGAGYNSSMR